MPMHMLRRSIAAPLAALALGSVSACCLIPGYTPKASTTETLMPAATTVVTGSATYPERMIAPPGSVLKVVLQDTSRADTPAVDLASWSARLDDGGVPRNFTLTPEVPFDPRMTYTVRASISGADDTLLWTTDTAHIVPVAADGTGTYDIGEIVMVMVAAYSPMVDAAPLAGTQWKVDGMGGTAVVAGSEPEIAFSDDGRISGSTGCNRFFGSYEQAGDALTFSDVGMTKMACMDDGIMGQEMKFASILNGAASFTIDGLGNLVLTGADGIGFVARPVQDSVPGDPAMLQGAAWVVEDINRGGVIDNSRLTLTFGADRRVSGSGGCNSFSGTYSADGSSVTLGPLAMTRRACLGEALNAQETRYTAALTGKLSWAILADGALELTGDAGKRVLLRR
ncbi:META domain-containing protein [Hyphomonas sp.]|uniref:META domain-containing protein n=1 Tax=Hyphomonas sp. TaxID=87 RepID=UPI00391D968E